MLVDPSKEKELDVRIRDKLIQKGILKQEDVDKHLAKLADETENMFEVEFSKLDEMEEARLQGGTKKIPPSDETQKEEAE